VRKIEKGEEPASLIAWKSANPKGRYNALSDVERKDIRQACTKEQFYLCAYCCQPVSGSKEDTANEHVEAQDLAKNRTLDFGNIVASCRAPRQCDGSHGSQPLPLTPLMPECEVELRFKPSGRVEGLTDRAKAAIQVLNLGDTEANNKALIEKRKRLCDVLLWSSYGAPVDQLDHEDEDLLRILIEDISTPKAGRLAPFAPVLANILRAKLLA
jgi:uncharacterized protein (TIGR02646 family)